jgi:hypothetical protein
MHAVILRIQYLLHTNLIKVLSSTCAMYPSKKRKESKILCIYLPFYCVIHFYSVPCMAKMHEVCSEMTTQNILFKCKYNQRFNPAPSGAPAPKRTLIKLRNICTMLYQSKNVGVQFQYDESCDLFCEFDVLLVVGVQICGS